MNEPDWYAEWRHEAIHLLQDKNAANDRDFQIGHWSRYDYDLEAGTLTFSHEGVPKVIADIQIVGTTSQRAGNWLWAWANDHFPPALGLDAEKTCQFGEEHDIGELINGYVEDEDLTHLGWELTAVAARVCEAAGAYRCPREEGGGFFLLYHNPRRIN